VKLKISPGGVVTVPTNKVFTLFEKFFSKFFWGKFWGNFVSK
jgi:hypothetical protein